MTTTVKYFGMIAEKLEKSEELIDFSSNDSSIDLHQFFEDRYPSLKNLTYKIAVDQTFMTHLTTEVTPSEIALLPPFAGG